jgi:hypothetical protein
MHLKRNKCKTKYCRRSVNHGGFCSTCTSRKCRQKNKLRYAYVTLKNNAKRRKIPFTISFEYFSEFAIRTHYIQNKGITHDSYTIDRKENDLGYIEGNLQILTNSQNSSKKRKKVLNYDYRTGTAIYF